MNRYTKLLAIILCAITACKKKDGANQNLDPNKQEGSNYMSTKPGSWWLFGARNGEITIRTATGKDSVKNGLKFSYFEFRDTSSQTITPEYYGKNENKYVSLFDMDGNKTDYVTLVFMEDSAKAGASWSNTQDYKYLGTTANLFVESNVEFTDGTLTLGGTTYTKVTKVHHNLKLKLQLQPAYSSVGRLDIWFAKDIGIIQRDIDVNAFGILKKQHMDSLLEYHIEK